MLHPLGRGFESGKPSACLALSDNRMVPGITAGVSCYEAVAPSSSATRRSTWATRRSLDRRRIELGETLLDVWLLAFQASSKLRVAHRTPTAAAGPTATAPAVDLLDGLSAERLLALGDGRCVASALARHLHYVLPSIWMSGASFKQPQKAPCPLQPQPLPFPDRYDTRRSRKAVSSAI